MYVCVYMYMKRITCLLACGVHFYFISQKKWLTNFTTET